MEEGREGARETDESEEVGKRLDAKHEMEIEE